jgi:Tfp pilus assembly protein PilF
LKQPNLELALESFNHAIRINPNAVLALTNRANFYLKKKEKDKGMADLKTV